MGGVFFVPTPESTEESPCYNSYVWQTPFPAFVQEGLVTWTQPNGTITNSDLELAATVAQNDVIANTYGVAEATIANLHDNHAAVVWTTKGSATTSGPACQLLRLQSLHARHYRYIHCHDFIPGSLNCMADEASRRLQMSSAQLLNFFDTHFPQPLPWRLCTLRSEMYSALTSCLRKKRCEPQLWQAEPVRPTSIGTCGWASVPSSPWILGSPKGTILYRTSKFSPKGSVMDASHPAVTPYDMAQLLTPCEALDRRIGAWGPLTPD